MNIISKGKKQIVLLLVFITCITGCMRMNVDISNKLMLPSHARIAVGPLANHSDTPMANRQVESMLVSLLQVKGFRDISHYQREKSCAKLLYCPDETLSKNKIIRWARLNRIDYVFIGAVNEWRYKVGLDGEPVAGVSLMVVNVNSGRTIWASVGSVIGGSRQGLDVVGQSLLECLLSGVYPTAFIVHSNKTVLTK